MCLKAAEYVTNSVDPYQTPRSAAFDFGLHCSNKRFVQCIWILGVYWGSFNPVVVGTCKLRKTVITVTETVTSNLQLEFILLKTLFRVYYAHLPNLQVLHLKMQRLLRWLLMPNHWLHICVSQVTTHHRYHIIVRRTKAKTSRCFPVIWTKSCFVQLQNRKTELSDIMVLDYTDRRRCPRSYSTHAQVFLGPSMSAYVMIPLFSRYFSFIFYLLWM